MANNHKSFAPLPFNNIEELVESQNKPPLANLGHDSSQMSDGLKFNLMPSSFPVLPSRPPFAPEGMLRENGERLEFSCKYCDRTFANKQALGGHQNAHKVLRFIEKNRNLAMLEAGYLTTDLQLSPSSPLVRSLTLNRETVNGPYYDPFVEKAFQGYPRGSAPGIMGNQIGDGSYFSTDANSNFRGERIAAASVNPLPNHVPKILFNSTIERVVNYQSNELEMEDSELDLTLKLGY